MILGKDGQNMKSTVIIIGGGWAGSAAALAAKQAGADRVVILERTDMLLGCGLAGGIMRIMVGRRRRKN